MNIAGKPIPLITLFLITGFFIFMLILALKELKDRKSGSETDVKSAIVSLGVLGTFLGIFLGLWEFNVNDIEGSVPKLLDGLKLAFVTSIMGMTISVLLSITEKTSSGAAKTEFDVLKKIDEKLEPLADGMKGIHNLDGQLKHMRTDIRDEQVASRNFLQEQFKQTNDSLKSAIDKLSEGATAEIIKALEKVILDFNSNLTEQFGDNFKKLNDAVNNLIAWQVNYKDQVEHSTEQLNAISTSLSGSKNTLDSVAERNKQVVAVYTHLQGILVEQHRQLELSGNHLEAQKVQIDAVRSTAEGFKSSIEKISTDVEGLTSGIKEALTSQSSSLKQLTQDIESELPKTLSELDSNLAGLTRRFASDYESFLQHYQGLVASNRGAN